MKRSVLAAAATASVIMLGFLTACSSNTDGNATATSSAATSTNATTNADSSTTDGQTAPKVRVPLNASGFISVPCNALTASQLPTLHLAGATGAARTTAGAPVCAWNAFDSSDATKSYGANISWMVPSTTGLSSLYAQKANQAYFNETSVAGYPAVFADVGDLRSQGTCVLNTAVSDSLYFMIQFSVSDSSLISQSCNLAQQAATDVIKNLGGG